MSETTTGEQAWPCPHCLQPLDYQQNGSSDPPLVESGGDLLIDLPRGWTCTNPDCPSKQSGYHPDEGAKERVLMLLQATEGHDVGPTHGG